MDNSEIRIAFFDTKPYDRDSFEEQNRAFNYQISWFESRLSTESVSMAAGHNVVCAFVNDNLGAEVMSRLIELDVKLIALRCAGFNNVDLKSACGKISVVRVPAYSPYAVAEYTLGLILCLNRKLHRAYCRIRENNFSINGLMGFELHGKTIGIVGTGKLGATFASLLQGFCMRVLAYDINPHVALAKELNLHYVDLQTLYAESDIISLHCPLTAENTYMINRATIEMMKDGVILINTSRGKLVDTRSLIEALKRGKIGGAGLDVYEEEEGYFYEDLSANVVDDDTLARLLTFPNVLVASHQAFFTKEAVHDIATTTLNNIAEYFQNPHERGTNSVCPLV